MIQKTLPSSLPYFQQSFQQGLRTTHKVVTTPLKPNGAPTTAKDPKSNPAEMGDREMIETDMGMGQYL